MPKLYHHEGRWLVPGQQDRKAARVDVPTSPEPLAAWLNARGVEVSAFSFAGVEIVADPAVPEGELHLREAPPCNMPSESTAPSSRCPKCNRLLCLTENAARASAHGAVLTTVSEWLDDAPAWAIDQLEVQLAERRALA